MIGVESFLTESSHDFLYVNNVAYHGSSGPEDAAIAAMREVKWSSDGSDQEVGWKVCLHQCAHLSVLSEMDGP